MSRAYAWKPANQIDPSSGRRKSEGEFKARIYRPGQPRVPSGGLLSPLEDPTEDELAIARERKRIAATVVSKRKRPDRKRELEMIEEFVAVHAGAGR